MTGSSTRGTGKAEGGGTKGIISMMERGRKMRGKEKHTCWKASDVPTRGEKAKYGREEKAGVGRGRRREEIQGRRRRRFKTQS